MKNLVYDELVLHPGSSVKLSREEGIQNIIDALNHVLTKEQSVSILLETMAGKEQNLVLRLKN